MNAIDERRLAASLRLLVAASRELATSFDYAHTLAAVGRLVVPAFAAGFSVEVDEGEIRTTLARTGRVGSDAEEYALVARGKQLGVLRISGARDAVDPETGLELWPELALRVAVSVDAAQVYAREHHVADTLQRALLPDRLPVDDRLAFDAAYLPGAEDAIVGGDWYDAFRLPDGRIAFSIGDVAGHGLRAAIVMGEVRQAFRAAALNPTSPSLVIERANTIVNMRPNPVMVTAIFGIADPRDGTVTYASAGHPGTAPRIAVRVRAALARRTGVPLGIVERIDATDWTFTVPPGALLTVYTDGLIEYSRDIIEGEQRLLAEVRAGIFDPDAEPARALVKRVFAARANTDDVATLTVAAADIPSADFIFTSLPLGVPLVRRSLDRFGQTTRARRRAPLLAAHRGRRGDGQRGRARLRRTAGTGARACARGRRRGDRDDRGRGEVEAHPASRGARPRAADHARAHGRRGDPHAPGAHRSPPHLVAWASCGDKRPTDRASAWRR